MAKINLNMFGFMAAGTLAAAALVPTAANAQQAQSQEQKQKQTAISNAAAASESTAKSDAAAAAAASSDLSVPRYMIASPVAPTSSRTVVGQNDKYCVARPVIRRMRVNGKMQDVKTGHYQWEVFALNLKSDKGLAFSGPFVGLSLPIGGKGGGKVSTFKVDAAQAEVVCGGSPETELPPVVTTVAAPLLETKAPAPVAALAAMPLQTLAPAPVAAAPKPAAAAPVVRHIVRSAAAPKPAEPAPVAAAPKPVKPAPAAENCDTKAKNAYNQGFNTAFKKRTAAAFNDGFNKGFVKAQQQMKAALNTAQAKAAAAPDGLVATISTVSGWMALGVAAAAGAIGAGLFARSRYKKRVADLEAKNTDLEARLAALEAKINGTDTPKAEVTPEAVSEAKNQDQLDKYAQFENEYKIRGLDSVFGTDEADAIIDREKPKYASFEDTYKGIFAGLSSDKREQALKGAAEAEREDKETVATYIAENAKRPAFKRAAGTPDTPAA